MFIPNLDGCRDPSAKAKDWEILGNMHLVHRMLGTEYMNTIKHSSQNDGTERLPRE